MITFSTKRLSVLAILTLGFALLSVSPISAQMRFSAVPLGAIGPGPQVVPGSSAFIGYTGYPAYTGFNSYYGLPQLQTGTIYRPGSVTTFGQYMVPGYSVSSFQSSTVFRPTPGGVAVYTFSNGVPVVPVVPTVPLLVPGTSYYRPFR